ncbi:MAG TPA: AMP-binding protein, partial [Candidatus Elarobacter sp.]|nr:AMP-binding protein [Candidatus Elarobacter sp.]
MVRNNGYADFLPSDRVAFAANPAFDASTMEVWGPLLGGGSIVVIDRDASLDANRFAQVLEQQQVTVLFVTTALFNAYAAAIPQALRRLRVLLCGGEQNDPHAFARVLDGDSKPQHLIHCYGPTETTTFATTYEVTSVPDGLTNVPIGRPISNTRVYIVDERLEPMPVGVAGELYVGGPGVALGYWERPELTAERFVASPFVEGDRLYKTGDRGRFVADGSIEFLGRNDFQVKIRGFRIELGEIETRLAHCAGIRDAVVLAREDVPGEKRLVAYYTIEAGSDTSAEALRTNLLELLPEYMVPAAYVHLGALPLNANGKVDRGALLAPDAAAYATEAYEAPLGEIETVVAQIWCEVLDLDRVGRSDNFFDLGGHSLLATRVMSLVQQMLQAEVNVTTIFAQPVLRHFAQEIARATRRPLPAIARADRHAPLPLSFAQQRLWFLAQIDGASEAYHVPLALRLRGTLDRVALGRALDRVVARHETLRTTFALVHGEPVQRIASEDIGFALVEHDLIGHADAARQAETLAAEEARAPFDLQTGPLIRGRLIALDPTEHL